MSDYNLHLYLLISKFIKFYYMKKQHNKIPISSQPYIFKSSDSNILKVNSRKKQPDYSPLQLKYSKYNYLSPKEISNNELISPHLRRQQKQQQVMKQKLQFNRIKISQQYPNDNKIMKNQLQPVRSDKKIQTKPNNQHHNYLKQRLEQGSKNTRFQNGQGYKPYKYQYYYDDIKSPKNQKFAISKLRYQLQQKIKKLQQDKAYFKQLVLQKQQQTKLLLIAKEEQIKKLQQDKAYYKQQNEAILQKQQKNKLLLITKEEQIKKLQERLNKIQLQLKQQNYMKTSNYKSQTQSLLKKVSSQRQLKSQDDNKKYQQNAKLKRDIANQKKNFNFVSQKVKKYEQQNHRLHVQNQLLTIYISHINVLYLNAVKCLKDKYNDLSQRPGQRRSTQPINHSSHINYTENQKFINPEKSQSSFLSAFNRQPIQAIPNQQQEIKRISMFYQQEYHRIKTSKSDTPEQVQKLNDLGMKLQNSKIQKLTKLDNKINTILQRLYEEVINLINKSATQQQISKDTQAFVYVQLANAKFALRRNIKQVEAIMMKGIDFYKSSENNYFEELIISLNNLALYYEHYNLYQASIKIYKKVLEIQNKYFQKQDERIFLLLNNLGCAYYQNKQYNEGQKIFQDLLQNKLQKYTQLYELVLKNYDHYARNNGGSRSHF